MPSKRLVLQGTVLGFILWAVLPMGTAQAAPSISISRGNNQQASGTIDISWTVSSAFGLKWAKAEILGSHAPSPSCVDRQPYGCDSTDDDPSTPSQYKDVSYTWDTPAVTPYNGTYTFRVTANDNDPSQPESFKDIYVLVNNPPQAPDWASGVASGLDGSSRPYVNLSWNYTGTEPDLREFQIVRNGPGGAQVVWSIFAANPGVNGTQCSKSGQTYSCTDTAFPGAYGGSYTYRVYALRSSPSGPNACHLDSTGNPYPNDATRPCIARNTDTTQSASFAAPPSTNNGGPSGSTGGGGQTNKSGGTTGILKPPPGQTILGGGTKSLANDNADFYTGTYDAHLPYQDRTVILPGQKIPFGSKSTTNSQVQEVGGNDPVGSPLKDRKIVVPFGIGLLLVLGAAHVKRLLSDR